MDTVLLMGSQDNNQNNKAIKIQENYKNSPKEKVKKEKIHKIEEKKIRKNDEQ